MAKPSNRAAPPVSGLAASDQDARPRLALIVSHDPTRRGNLAGVLSDLGYETVRANSAADAQGILGEHPCAFTVFDLNGLGPDDAEFLRFLSVQAGECGPIIAVDGSVPLSVRDAAALDALAVVGEPVTREELEAAINHALLRPRRGRSAAGQDDQARLDEELALWRSPRMLEIRGIIELIAGPDIAVLIRGETGTGKDVVARSIHYLSARRTRPFVKVNCAALPRDLLESELFGHERGAFTGAHELKIGQFERAHHGTIFLDEIGDLHPDLQGKLLHVLQDGQFSRVGGRTTIKVNVRVLAATNQDLERNVAAGTFREDLLYRLNAIQIDVPPLRERREEIPALAQYFVHRYCQMFRREPFALTPATVERLMQHRYAGNVRELENIVKRMIVLDDPCLVKNGPAPGRPTDRSPGPPPPAPRPATSLKEIGRRAAQDAERTAILQMLEQTRWNRLRAAKLLNISYRALLYKIKESGIGLQRQDDNGHD